jgi:5-methylcytosine-specific restriction endonuclease McrA
MKRVGTPNYINLFESEFLSLTEELLEKNLTFDELIIKLEIFLGSEPNFLFNTDIRVRKLIEYCFYKAEGPYNPEFTKFKPIIKKILQTHPPIKNLLGRSADHAIANMVLGKRGKLKFAILDIYELKKTLKFWEEMDLGKITEKQVFYAVLEKNNVKKILNNENDPFYLTLITRLKLVFPYFIKKVISKTYNIEEEIYKLTRDRFKFVDDLLLKGNNIDKLIEKENQKFELGMKRNYYLSFLVKKKHFFKCQICSVTNERIHNLVEAHHIVPIYKGGDDHSENLIVLCKKHHFLADKNKIYLEISGKNIKVTDRSRKYILKTN